MKDAHFSEILKNRIQLNITKFYENVGIKSE